jgi:hypothetical protein
VTTEAEPEPAAAAESDVAVVPAASAGTPAANQVTLAAWDIAMPFQTDDRIIDGKRAAVITRLLASTNAAEAGDWLQSGVVIHAVNNAPVGSADALTLSIMNAMSVDPDGRARVIIDYTDPSGDRKSGLLTVGVVRLINLANGVGLRALVIDGAWKTEVTAVTRPDATDLRQGDILFRDKTTTVPLDGPASLEAILADLVGQGRTETEFSIIRDSKVSEARMQLALEGAP